ncbi:MAG: hypothetical protein ABEJ36_02800 [Candidatus Nanosalina sp.]
MTMRRFAVAAFVVLAFSGMAVAQPAAQGPGNGPGGPPEDPGEDSPDDDEGDEAEEAPGNESEEDEDELPEEMEEMNGSEEDENVTELNESEGPPENVPGRSAQFDARLMTAINTLETLVDIAPSDEARQSLRNAVEILRDVQNTTDTASLGPDAPEEENETELNETEMDEEELNETEVDESEVEGSGEDRGQRQGRGPPGFVRGLLGGLFG